MRGQAGQFMVDGSSPETQWDVAGAPAAGRLSGDAAIWRFTVLPMQAGRGILQLAVSARTVGADGIIAELLLPEQAFEIIVTKKASESWMAKAGLLLLAGFAGMAILAAIETLMRADALAVLRRFLSF
ncbi:MAG: hypothetical protein JSS20_09595 [Proteobacteria bacterium]|nr:hypothetical protein [Pseudomonadota bacterium]